MIQSCSQIQQMVIECKRKRAIKFPTKLFKDAGRGRGDWVMERMCMKRAVKLQYVLPCGYACSCATLIIQSGLPSPLTGLIAQKYFLLVLMMDLNPKMKETKITKSSKQSGLCPTTTCKQAKRNKKKEKRWFRQL